MEGVLGKPWLGNFCEFKVWLADGDVDLKDG